MQFMHYSFSNATSRIGRINESDALCDTVYSETTFVGRGEAE